MAPRVLTENAVLTHPGSATVYIFALIILPLPNPYIGIRLQTPIFVYSASDGTVNLVSVSDPKGKQALTHSSATGPIRTGTSALIPIKVREKGSTGTYASCKSGFVTGGRDGKVQVWAVEGSAGVPEGGYQVGLAGEVATPNGQAVSALAANHERSLLVAGTELEGEGPGDVAVHIWSYTNLSSPQLLHSYTDSHTDTITSLHFHIPAPLTPDVDSDPTPAQRQLQLLSCSTDGLINIYDPSIADEDDAVLVVFNNKAAVSHVSSVLAYSSPASPSVPTICAISHDEKFGVFEVEDTTAAEGAAVAEEDAESTEWPVLDLRQALQADYAIDLRPRGLTEADYGYLGNGMVLATGTYREETLANTPSENTPFVDLFLVAPVRADVAAAAGTGTGGAATAGFKSAVRLRGAHGEEIVRDVWFEETAPFVLTVGEDGCVRLWSDEKRGVERGGREKEDVEMAGVRDGDVGGEKASRAERRQKRKEKRHKPY